MGRVIQLRQAEPHDEAPLDLMPHMDQVHSNLRRVARVIIQLDKRMTCLEQQEQLEPENIEPEPQENWRGSGSENREHPDMLTPRLGLMIAIIASSLLFAYLLAGLLGILN